jgi:hypothetical protein
MHFPWPGSIAAARVKKVIFCSLSRLKGKQEIEDGFFFGSLG